MPDDAGKQSADKAEPEEPDDPDTKQAKLDKLRAEARKAEAEADVAVADAAFSMTPLGMQRREAVAQKEVAEADNAAATARRSEIAALIPDLSKVKPSTLEIGKDGPPLGSTSLSFGAIGDAAELIAEDIQTTLGLKGQPKTAGAAPTTAPPAAQSTTTVSDQPAPEAWVLVTSESDLATGDGLYREVSHGLAQLEAAAAAALKEPPPRPASPEPRAAGMLAGGAAVIGALAGALPSVLSLLSAERSVRTTSVTVNDLAATAAVAGALRARTPRIHVFHDDFRLVDGAEVYAALDRVAKARQDLVAAKIDLTDRKTTADADLPGAKESEANAKKAFDAATNRPAAVRDKLRRDLVAAQEVVARLTKASAAAAVRISTIDSVVAAIDAFTTAIRAIPAGGKRSPLTTAALHELLHPAAKGSENATPGEAPKAHKLTHVLLVKGQAGTAAETIDNKPLWFEDHFSTIVDVSITYMLIQADDSEIIDADTVTVTATARGTIGEKPVVDIEMPAGPAGLGISNPHRTARVWSGDQLASAR